MGKIIDGTDLMVFVGGKSIALATNHTLNISAETADSTSHKDAKAGWIERTVKTTSWELSSENLYAVAGDGDDTVEGQTFLDLFDTMTGTEKKVDVIFGIPTKDDGNDGDVDEGGWEGAKTTYLKGKAYITSLEANAPCGENATFSVTFSGTGKLEKVTA